MHTAGIVQQRFCVASRVVRHTADKMDTVTVMHHPDHRRKMSPLVQDAQYDRLTAGRVNGCKEDNVATIVYRSHSLTEERLSNPRSGNSAEREPGILLGRQSGQRPRSDKLATKVLQAIEDGRSYRWIARDLGISKNTITDIVRRHCQNAL